MIDESSRNTPPHSGKNVLSPVISTVIAGSLMAVASQAHALSWELDNGVTVDLDTSITYDAQWRQEKQDSTVLGFGGNPLGLVLDDGNRAFDDGDMTQNRASFSSDLDINYGDGGVFLRARGWYDEVYDDDGFSAKSFQRDGLDEHQSEIELLDTFVYHTFDIDNRSASVRLGKQVVNWGESLFVYGGISSAQAPLDATKANAPGVELKDIFLPLGQAYVETDLTEKLSLGAYYQYEWDNTRIDAPGTYFGVDFLGQGSVGDTVDIGLPVTEARPDDGQYGITLRYLAEELNNTEFAFYYLNYHDFLPAAQWSPAVAGVSGDPLWASQITQQYFEDIKLIGVSFGTVFGDTNVSGEVSYRDGQPVQLDLTSFGPAGGLYFTEAETLQTQVSLIHLIGETPFADNLALTAEIGYNRVLDIDADANAAALGIDVNDINSALDEDRDAAGVVLSLGADYFAVSQGLDLKVTGTYRNDFDGVSPVPFTFTEGLEQLSLKADFTYLNNHNFGVSYVWFLTDPDEVLAKQGELEFGHLTADKDYLAAYYKYRF